jgi:hypothetical protein
VQQRHPSLSRHAVGLAAVLLVAAGCSADRTTRDVSSTDRSVRTGKPALTRVDPVPRTIPPARLFARPPGTTRLLAGPPGIVHYFRWIDRGRIRQTTPADPVPWPSASTRSLRGRLFVSFGHVSPPQYVELRVFAEDSPDRSPVRLTSARCARNNSQVRPCAVHYGSVGIDVPAARGRRHVSVFAVWAVTPDAAVPGRIAVGDELYATWLFTLA